MAIGRLSSQQEITAMKASGLSLYQIAAPVFLISFIGMVSAVVVNLHYAPQSRVAYKQLMGNAVSENPVGFIEERRFIDEFPWLCHLSGRSRRIVDERFLDLGVG
jgi:lipopolysaccharide export system permease protein